MGLGPLIFRNHDHTYMYTYTHTHNAQRKYRGTVKGFRYVNHTRTVRAHDVQCNQEKNHKPITKYVLFTPDFSSSLAKTSVTAFFSYKALSNFALQFSTFAIILDFLRTLIVEGKTLVLLLRLAG